MNKQQSGFTAIELLITLFVAAAFLVAGYQLFSLVIKDGGQARAESRAGNVAYDYMRRYAPAATNPCTEQTPLAASAVSIEGLSNAQITVTITCPEFSVTSLSRVNVSISYNTPQQTVNYSTFTNGSSTETADVTDGLVGWWKFNGDTTTSVGALNGTGVNITSTDGQGGLPNTAYSFNGTSSYVTYGNDAAFSTPNLTMTEWIKPTSISTTMQLMSKELSYKVVLSGTGGIQTLYGSTGAAWSLNTTYVAPAVTAGNWAHVAYVVNSSNSAVYVYVNGALVGTSTITSPTGYSANPFSSGSHTVPATTQAFNGAIDDVRFYNRALSATEINTIYSGGAK
jgi:prepilin-type N-terminal cleavage/methylation domain-containing protein